MFHLCVLNSVTPALAARRFEFQTRPASPSPIRAGCSAAVSVNVRVLSGRAVFILLRMFAAAADAA